MYKALVLKDNNYGASQNNQLGALTNWIDPLKQTVKINNKIKKNNNL